MFNPAQKGGQPVRGKQFEEVRTRDYDRNKFNMSYAKRGTYNFNYLYPVDIQEVIPGDTWNLKRSAIAKAAPLSTPLYARCEIFFHTFYVPSRLLWANYKKMRSIGDGTQSLLSAQTYEAPRVPSVQIQQISYQHIDWSRINTLQDLTSNTSARLLNEIGLPLPVQYDANGPQLYESMWQDNEEEISILPFRAYYLIWYEYYRDQNNYTSLEPQTTDTITQSELSNITVLRTRAWQHDYFTSALLTPQRGLAVSFGSGNFEFTGNIPFSSISFNGASTQSVATFKALVGTNRRALTYETAFNGNVYGEATLSGGNLTANNATIDGVSSQNRHDILSGNIDNAVLQLDGGSITIETLRQASRLQEFLEKQARCGSRYTEFLLSMFGVISSDARLQRPEYIAGGRMPLNISTVVNQAQEGLGDYTSLGVASSGDLDKFSYYCEEDGYIITMMSIMPQTGYSQGLPRMFKRLSTFDFCLPDFAQLGEQEVKQREIFLTDDLDENNKTFGYQSRYQDYKYHPDVICGEFCTTAFNWTLTRFFTAAPSLDYNFLMNPGYKAYRSFQTTEETYDHFFIDFWNDWIVERKLPEFNIPTLA